MHAGRSRFERVFNTIPEPKTYWKLLGHPETSLSKFNQEHDGKRELETLENKTVVQKMNYIKNCDRVCADL